MLVFKDNGDRIRCALNVFFKQLIYALSAGVLPNRIVPLDEERNLDLAARNNPRLNVVRALGVSVVDLLDCDTVVISEAAIKRLNEVLAQ